MGSGLGWLRARVWGLSVGAVVTAAVIGVYLRGGFRSFSASLLDFTFTHFNPIEADDRIVLIDITDYAVVNVHRWPWPRRLHADLIHTLHELGARAVLMDLVFDAPEAARVVHPLLNPDYEFDDLTDLAAEVNVTDAVRDDDEFQSALREAGNVYLGMMARTYDPPYFPNEVRARAYEIFETGPADLSPAAFDARMRQAIPDGVDWMPAGTGRSAEQRNRVELFERLRVEHLLEGDFSLTEEQLAVSLGMSQDRVEKHFAPAKRTVARRLVRRWRDEHPAASWAETFEGVLPGRSLDVETPDLRDLRRAYRAISSERNVLQSATALDPSLIGRVRNAADFTMPYWKFTQAARTGLVVFDADEVDGVMRRVPLIVNNGGRMIPHLGFALACDVLDIDPQSIAVEDGDILAMHDRSGRRFWRIQLDQKGYTLINWHSSAEQRTKWQYSFEHIPVAYVLRIPLNRRTIEQAQGYETLVRGQFVDAVTADAPAAYKEYALSVQRLKQQRWEALVSGPTEELAELEAQVRAVEENAIDAVRGWAKDIRDYLGGEVDASKLEPSDRRILELADRQDLTTLAWQTSESIARRQAEIRDLLTRLRPRIAGKICLIGYSAAAVADTVNTPVFDEVPGVMAHANVINSMLRDRFPRTLPLWFDWTMIVLVGLPVTVVTTWRGPGFSLLMLLLVLVTLLVAAFSAFDWYAVHVDVVAPLVAAFLSWAFVTLYRQLTEERQKRAFSKSLAQYTSPAIASKLAEQLSRQKGAVDLSPRSCEVTCFFSDLKGFTSISERLGASRTREVLNPYLEAMSDVLIRSNAMINKFMGDGIFAFYNPPILPVADHAKAACDAALDSFAALERLKQTLAKGDIEQEVRELKMRVGINTGEVFVGDYGSSNKLDYTCIGDTVNLSARLEPACKAFGISAMISETTLRAANDAYVVRHLGGLQVVGKKLGVGVYELIGRKGEVDLASIEYAELYGQAVEKFQERDWMGALRVITECRKRRPDDLALDLLEDNVRRHQEHPPPADWNRAIELTTK